GGLSAFFCPLSFFDLEDRPMARPAPTANAATPATSSVSTSTPGKCGTASKKPLTGGSGKFGCMQPQHIGPAWVQKLSPPFHLVSAQADTVIGPLQPRSQRHSGSSNFDANCPAS